MLVKKLSLGDAMTYEPFGDEFFKLMRKMIKDFDRTFKELDREFPMFEKFERELVRRPGVTGFEIEIKDSGTGKPEIRVTRLREPSRVLKPEICEAPKAKSAELGEAKKIEAKPVVCMLETNTAKVEKPDELILTMQAPGVNKKDVDVRQLGRAIEVVARKPTGEAHFATFELLPDALPSELSLDVKGGMLVIRIPRRRRLPHAGMR